MSWVDADQADLLFKPDVVYNTGNGISDFGQWAISRNNLGNKNTEYCNGEDDDCDGQIDEDATLLVTNTANSGLVH